MKVSKWIALMLATLVMIAYLPGCAYVDGAEEALPLPELKVGDYFQMGQYNGDPIVWRFIDEDDNGKLILSDKILCYKIFDDDGRDAENKLVHAGSTFWEESNIRSWLNSAADVGKVKWLCGDPPVTYDETLKIYPYADEKGFLHSDNFTQQEREVMKSVTQWTLLSESRKSLSTNGVSSFFLPPQIMVDIGPSSTLVDDWDIRRIESVIGYMYELEDTVFLLDELQAKKLWENLGTLAATPTEQAASEGLNVYYWLRSPVCYEYRPMNKNGVRQVGEEYRYSAQEPTYSSGVRPAFYLDEAAAQILSGSGTEVDPYVIDGKKNDNIHVYCDGWELKFDVQPVNENGRVLVPMRKIFETLGAEISWNESTRTVTAIKDETTVSLQIDQREMYVNGEMIWLDVPPQIIDNRTLIPLRAISEALGANVEWIEEPRRVNITT